MVGRVSGDADTERWKWCELFYFKLLSSLRMLGSLDAQLGSPLGAQLVAELGAQ